MMTESSTSKPRITDVVEKRLLAQATSTFELVFCKVCNQPTVNRIRCGVLACEACKKFFQRNRKNGESLRCVSGTYDCPLSDDRAALTSSGTVWRLVCPRCRLAKCLAVGMRVLGRKTKSKQLETSTYGRSSGVDCLDDNTVGSSTNSLPAEQSASSGNNNNSGQSNSPLNGNAKGNNGTIHSSSPHSPPPLSKLPQNLSTKSTIIHQPPNFLNGVHHAPQQQHQLPAHFFMPTLKAAGISSLPSFAHHQTPPKLTDLSSTSSAASAQHRLSHLPDYRSLNYHHQLNNVTSSSTSFNSSSSQAGPSPSNDNNNNNNRNVEATPSMPVSLLTPILSRTPPRIESTRNEELLNLTVHATRDLMNKFDSMPLRANAVSLNNDVATWLATMAHYETASRNVMTFGKQFPANEQLSAEDRCLLYANAISPLSVAQNLNTVHPFNMNMLNYNTFIKYFPEYANTHQETINVNRTLNQWNPSAAEYSLLMALLLYQNHPGLSNPGIIEEIVRQLNSVHQSLLAQQFPNDPSVVEARVRQLSQIVDMVRSTSANRVESFNAVRNRRPDLLQMGRLYSNVYSNAINNSNNAGTSSRNSPPAPMSATDSPPPKSSTPAAR